MPNMPNTASSTNTENDIIEEINRLFDTPNTKPSLNSYVNTTFKVNDMYTTFSELSQDNYYKNLVKKLSETNGGLIKSKMENLMSNLENSNDPKLIKYLNTFLQILGCPVIKNPPFMNMCNYYTSDGNLPLDETCYILYDSKTKIYKFVNNPRYIGNNLTMIYDNGKWKYSPFRKDTETLVPPELPDTRDKEKELLVYYLNNWFTYEKSGELIYCPTADKIHDGFDRLVYRINEDQNNWEYYMEKVDDNFNCVGYTVYKWTGSVWTKISHRVSSVVDAKLPDPDKLGKFKTIKTIEGTKVVPLPSSLSVEKVTKRPTENLPILYQGIFYILYLKKNEYELKKSTNTKFDRFIFLNGDIWTCILYPGDDKSCKEIKFYEYNTENNKWEEHKSNTSDPKVQDSHHKTKDDGDDDSSTSDSNNSADLPSDPNDPNDPPSDPNKPSQNMWNLKELLSVNSYKEFISMVDILASEMIKEYEKGDKGITDGQVEMINILVSYLENILNILEEKHESNKKLDKVNTKIQENIGICIDFFLELREKFDNILLKINSSSDINKQIDKLLAKNKKNDTNIGEIEKAYDKFSKINKHSDLIESYEKARGDRKEVIDQIEDLTVKIGNAKKDKASPAIIEKLEASKKIYEETLTALDKQINESQPLYDQYKKYKDKIELKIYGLVQESEKNLLESEKLREEMMDNILIDQIIIPQLYTAITDIIKKLKDIIEDISQEGGNGTNMELLLTNSNIEAHLKKINEENNNDLFAFNFNMEKRVNMKRYVIESDSNYLKIRQHHNKNKSTNIERVEWEKIKYKEKLNSIFNILKNLGYIFVLDDEFDEKIHAYIDHVLALVMKIAYQKLHDSHIMNIYENHLKKKLVLIFEDYYHSNVEQLERSKYILNHMFKYYCKLLKYNDLTYLNIGNKIPLFNTLCNSISNIPNSKENCNKFIIECILGGNIINSGSPQSFKSDAYPNIPKYEKCKNYLDNDQYWNNIIKDIEKTPEIIIFSILIIFKFKIKQTNFKDSDDISFLEFESYDSWLNDTLKNQLESELPNENELREAHNNIKENTKLRELFTLYLDMVPLQILNTSKTVNETEYKRTIQFKNLQSERTIEFLIAEATAKQIESRRKFSGGSTNFDDNKYLLRTLSHQIYNLNKSINYLKQSGGGPITIEKDSDLMNAIKFNSEQNGFRKNSTYLQGIMETLHAIQPMTPSVRLMIADFVKEVKESEDKLIASIVLFNNIISDNDLRNITLDEKSLRKIFTNFAKKSMKNIEQFQNTIKMMKGTVWPLYKGVLGSSLYMKLEDLS